MATAIAGFLLKINPFDQPNVEAAKTLARKMMAEFEQKGRLPSPVPTFHESGITVYAPNPTSSIRDSLNDFFMHSESPHYVVFQVYLKEDPAIDAILNSMRIEIRDRFKIATMVGYGPSYLHSTGQLHKGDSGNGMIIQIASEVELDAAIPDFAGSDETSTSFALLTQAESFGDRQALIDAGRKVIRFDLGKDVHKGLKKLSADLSLAIGKFSLDIIV